MEQSNVRTKERIDEKMRFKEFVWLIYYSFIKEPFLELVSILAEVKKAKTWLYIGVIAAAYSAYIGKTVVIKILLPFIILIYLIRNNIEGAYKKDLFEHDLKSGKDTNILQQSYQQYKQKCFFAKTVAMSYEDWKENEINKRCINNPRE